MTNKEFFKIVKSFSSERNLSIEEGFPLWVLTIFYPNFNDDSLYECIRGLENNDESVDAFVKDTSKKELVFFQFKSTKSEKNISATRKSDLSYLYDIVNKLDNHEYIDRHKNDRIQEISVEYAIAKKKRYNIRMIFADLGGKLADVSILDSYNHDNISYKYVGFSELCEKYEEYDSLVNLTKPEELTLNLHYIDNPEIIETTLGYHKTLISILTGNELVKLRDKFRYKLFDKNIRFSLGQTKVNKQIIKSATDEPEKFYFYNNGITITCKGFKCIKQKIRVEYPQVINGAQTVDSIYIAYKKLERTLTRKFGDKQKAKEEADNRFKKIKIMFRLIRSVADKSDFEDKVIEYNNTQSPIKIRDFCSNKKEQIELQKAFAKEGYFYEIKRGERAYISSANKDNIHTKLGVKLKDFTHKNEKLDIEILASLYQAFRGKPASGEVGAKYILNLENDDYREIFNEDGVVAQKNR